MGGELNNGQKKREGKKRTISSLNQRYHITPLSMKPARITKIKESKYYSTFCLLHNPLHKK
jgi:hypothetical protein